MFVVLAVLLLSLAAAAQASSITSSYPPSAWQIQGPGSTSVTQSNGCLEFNYDFRSTSVYYGQSWTFSAIANQSETLNFTWNHSGFHSWYRVTASAKAFSQGPGGTTKTLDYINPYGPFNVSGSESLQINQGYRFGFTIYGKNYDSNDVLRGTLTICGVNLNTPPTISAVGNQSIVAGTSTGPLGFTVGDAETPAGSLSVSATSSNQALVPNSNVSLAGSGSGRTVTVTPVPGQVGTTVITLTVSDGSLSAVQSFVVNVTDPTPPVIAPTVSGALGNNGWYVSDVTVFWNVTDPETAVTTNGCNTTTITTDTGGTTLTCQATSAGGTSSQSVTIKKDATAPTITGAADRPANANGWYNGDVTVSFMCADALSGVASCSSPVTLGEGPGQAVNGSVTDLAGNTAATAVVGINIDETVPVVTYSGNAGSYSVAQSVNITCASSDALSGVASDTCADVTGPAYSFNLGVNNFTASATDFADNVGTGSTSFTVGLSVGSLCELTNQFVSNKGIANSLCQKLQNSGAAGGRGKAKAADNVLGAYIHEVQAQTGKALTPAQSDVLIRLAQSLMAQ